MTKFKGTQGEWETAKKVPCFNADANVIVKIRDSKKIKLICCLNDIRGDNYEGLTNEEIQSNAKLIAAAKDLLEALQYADENIQTVSSTHITLPREFKTIMLNAINKALNN